MKIRVLALLFCVSTGALSVPGQDKTASCTPCHGAQGVSINPDWPSLAGQHVNYLIKQIQNLQHHQGRQAPTMTPFIANLNPEEIREIATFYAKQPLPENSTPQPYVKRGEQLYRGGDFLQHITACIACHGPKGTGNGEAGFPALSGQQAAYMVQQLQAFKNGTRSNDLNAIMRDISRRMSQNDMEAVSNYVAGLH